jgi:CheY-like chemotaxis protein
LKKLAIIEEDSDAREMAAFTFENNGYVVTRCNKETAVDEIAKLQPHVIVVDYQLGSMNGNDLSAKLKANPLTGQIPIVIYSATKTVDEISGCGCADGYIAKPLDLSDFVYLVQRIALSGSAAVK